MAKERTERMMINMGGEYHQDLLTVDAYLEGKPKATHALNLLGKALNMREAEIQERLGYLAKKRGMSADEMWQAILDGTADSNE